MIPYKQLSLANIFTDCQEKFENDKPAFLSLLETHIDIDEIIPISFRNHFYVSTGRTRKYPFLIRALHEFFPVEIQNCKRASRVSQLPIMFLHNILNITIRNAFLSIS